MVYSEIFHNDDTFHAYNETNRKYNNKRFGVNQIPETQEGKNNQDGGMHYEYKRLDKRGSRSYFNGRIPCKKKENQRR